MSSVPDARPAATLEARRAEHDALAERLAIRRSVDEVRAGLYLAFAGLLSAGLVVKLAWDRWGTLSPGVVRKLHLGPPFLLWLATAVATALLLFAIRRFLRGRRLMREEDELYARFRALRAELGLDP